MQPHNEADRQAEAALTYFEDVEGMMTSSAARAMIFLLETQEAWGVSGDIFETGVYKGKSASVLCHYARPSETVVLVDAHYQEHTQHLTALFENIVFVQAMSEKLPETYRGLAGHEANVRIFHADGSHRYTNVQNDMRLAERLLGDDGVLVLDDFLNPHFGQVQAAAHAFLNERPGVFSFFLVGANKAFLCRPNAHRKYFNRALKAFPERCAALGEAILLSATDTHPAFDALFFRTRKSTDASPLYGETIYGSCYAER